MTFEEYILKTNKEKSFIMLTDERKELVDFIENRCDINGSEILSLFVRFEEYCAIKKEKF